MDWKETWGNEHSTRLRLESADVLIVPMYERKKAPDHADYRMVHFHCDPSRRSECLYLFPEEARLIADALNRAADQVEKP